ncbi:hypothetical protein BIZ78_gp245 [Erwinia phage vB_EamM_Caitlin]|uniref:hypothetical protein n=1 Tax=Erwinia phage vB_EamM_Caitlin TaxID=1883379 RepID=UPI00081C6D10|nr:hypothetical protein BIZ78_gp245 [Erwinia phage vB_EamM_Caitlin]ANZ48330.1 hypothetical protein CAITLIN_35 [Erwinia phage vB_EamM_Caitlin]
MVIAVGTVSTRGWAKTTKEKITELMNHYTEAGYSQSVIYRDNIKSYSWSCAQYAQQPELLVQQVEADLRRLYGNVFPEGAEADVNYEFINDNKIKYRVIISLRVMVDGEWFDVTKALEVDASGGI